VITLDDLHGRFTRRELTPREHLDRVLDALRGAASRAPAHAAVRDYNDEQARRAADAATARFASGRALGAFDGIPIVVKDEVDVAGLPTRAGTLYRPAIPASRDATAVARLRDAGAVVVGKSAQHELGLGATGISPHEARTPRNPHDPRCAPGGSSSGSAVAVALGAVPVAVASDGGGSVRIPASLCGVWGLKPTFGRIPNTGDDNLDGTLGHLGPIARSVDAMERFLRVTAGDDGRCPVSRGTPALDLAALDGARGRDLTGLRIGVDPDEWADANPTIAFICREALRTLEKQGATLRDVSLPLGRHAGAIGFVTMAVEAARGHAEEYRRHRDQMALDVRLAIAIGGRISAVEHQRAQLLRRRLRRQMAAVLGEVDLYASPTVASAAPKVRPRAEIAGEADQATTNDLVRFTFLGNLTGLPALTAPVGVQGARLPVGLQLMARPWDEATLLAAAYGLERAGYAPPRPAVGVGADW
jgi:aspartyl-tRNA(Asn)/glutamyl-tRNA(Gln) amidotransferase subunit A